MPQNVKSDKRHFKEFKCVPELQTIGLIRNTKTLFTILPTEDQAKEKLNWKRFQGVVFICRRPKMILKEL